MHKTIRKLGPHDAGQRFVAAEFAAAEYEERSLDRQETYTTNRLPGLVVSPAEACADD